MLKKISVIRKLTGVSIQDAKSIAYFIESIKEELSFMIERIPFSRPLFDNPESNNFDGYEYNKKLYDYIIDELKLDESVCEKLMYMPYKHNSNEPDWRHPLEILRGQYPQYEHISLEKVYLNVKDDIWDKEEFYQFMEYYSESNRLGALPWAG